MTAFAAPVMLTGSISSWRGRRSVGTTCNTRPRMAAAVPSSDGDPPLDLSAGAGQVAGLRPGEMAVRFTNTPSGTDMIAGATPGDVLLAVGDSVGITIPRACVSGLCGSCTCDIVDPASPGGVQTVRACQTLVVDVVGSGEMTVDLARMKQARGSRAINPMARFDNMDTEYVAGAPPKRMDKRGNLMRVERPCTECATTGDVECYGCDGTGTEGEASAAQPCLLCAGTGSLRCAHCQGSGVIMSS